MTLTTLTNAINGILGFRGQRIGFPDGSYYNECTAIVAHLHSRLGIPLPSMFGARADGWGVQFPGELAPYYDHEAYQPGKAYPYGTLLLWNSPHIAIVLSHDGGNLVQVFQQNADPNGAPCEVFNRVINNQFHTCTYALIPKLEQPPQEPLWRPEIIPAVRKKVQPGKAKWNLAYETFDQVNSQGEIERDKQTEFTATAILHHRNIPQYNYYLEDPNTPHGWNVLDCLDYVAPPPPVAAPTPPAAPATFPSAYEPYWLRTTIKWYPTALSARNDMNARGTIAQGNYLTYRADGDMLCLVREKGGEQYWINPADNVEPVATPEPVVAPPPVVITPVVVTPVPETAKPKPSYHWLNETDRLPYRYRSTNTTPVPMKILEGNLRLNPVPAHWEGDFSMYTIVNGITYFLPDTTRKAGWMYGIPETMLTEVKPGLDTNHNGVSDVTEVIAKWDKFIDIIPDWVNKTAPIIAPRVRLATKQGRQVIDGIISVKKRKDKIQ